MCDQQLAQAPQRVADRRLRDPEPHRGARDAALARQRIERDHQVEVDRREPLRRDALFAAMTSVHVRIRRHHWIHDKRRPIVHA